MASKKELFAEATVICDKHGIEGEARAELLALVEPKRSGAKFDIEDVTCVDSDGTITHIMDSVFKLWLPVYDSEGEANFYEKPDTEMGWSRFSRAAEKSRKDNEKAYKATKDGVLTDLLADEISNEDAKEIMTTAEEARKTLTVPEDMGASEERPAA